MVGPTVLCCHRILYPGTIKSTRLPRRGCFRTSSADSMRKLDLRHAIDFQLARFRREHCLAAIVDGHVVYLHQVRAADATDDVNA